MEQEFNLLHRSMLEQINSQLQSGLSEHESVSNCFWIAITGWENLKKIVNPTELDPRKEQPFFFRYIKPKFTSYIQYYTMVAEAVLFIPDKNEIEILYWEQEAKRTDWYFKRHEVFKNYYESGQQHLDQLYFTCIKERTDPKVTLMKYDADLKYCSSHDWIVRGLLAYQMFYEYCQDKINLTHQKSRY